MKNEIIRRSRLFSGMNDENLSFALTALCAEEKSYGKGELLHLAGEPVLRFGLVLSGVIQIYTDDINGNQMMMANVTEGETFGESLCYLQIPDAPVYIRAGGESEVLWLCAEVLRKEQTDSRLIQLSFRFSAMLAQRTLSMNDRIQILSKKTIREKLTAFFTQCERQYKSRSFSIPFDRESLAVYLGVDRSALSRELSAMKDDRILQYDRNSFKIL